MLDVHAAVKGGPVTRPDRRRDLPNETAVRDLALAVRDHPTASTALDVCFRDDALAREWIAQARGSVR